MELVTFDFRSLIVLILSFIGCGTVFSPPEPVSIQTPRSVTTEKVSEPNAHEVFLTFELDKSTQIHTTIKTDKISDDISVLADKKKIEQAIIKAQQLAKEQSRQMSVMIKGDYSSNSTDFKELIAALKEKQIFKFQLVSTPK